MHCSTCGSGVGEHGKLPEAATRLFCNVSSTNVEVSISKGITYVFINLMFVRKRSLYWLFALPGTENPASITLTL